MGWWAMTIPRPFSIQIETTTVTQATVSTGMLLRQPGSSSSTNEITASTAEDTV